MAASVDRLFWLLRDDQKVLRAHAMLGDEICPPMGRGEWFRAAPARSISRGDRVLMLRYESARMSIAFCTPAPQGLQASALLALRESLSPAGAERAWAPFVGRFGAYETLAAANGAWLESEFRSEGAVWRVRRGRHPCALIDRLLARDRMAATAQIDAAFSAFEVGDVPLEASIAKVGDGREVR